MSVGQPEAATALSVSTHGSALSLGDAWAGTVDQNERIRSMVDKYVHPVEWHRPMPAALAEAVPAA